MDFHEPTPPKKHNVFLPIILSLVLVLGVWLGYFLTNQINSGSTFNPSRQASTNDKINSLLEYIEYNSFICPVFFHLYTRNMMYLCG